MSSGEPNESVPLSVASAPLPEQCSSGGGEMSTSREAELLAAALCGDIVRLQTLLPVAGDLTAFAASDGVIPTREFSDSDVI
jgi:hypothetical protein